MQKGVHSAQAHSADQIHLLTSAIDKAAKRRIIHRNAARRRKQRLTRALATAK
jgi:ribosomal protein S20